MTEKLNFCWKFSESGYFSNASDFKCIDIRHKHVYIYFVENIRWDPAKNQKLKSERNISFEEVMACIENNQTLAIIQNPSKKFIGQMVFVVSLNDYIYYVPFVKNGDDIFLKTIIPSRKLTRKYLKPGGNKNA